MLNNKLQQLKLIDFGFAITCEINDVTTESLVAGTPHVLEIGRNCRLIAIYRNDNRALKRDKSAIFNDIFNDYSDKSRFISDFLNC